MSQPKVEEEQSSYHPGLGGEKLALSTVGSFIQWGVSEPPY